MDRQRINTDTLLEIIQTRMKSNDNNPTLGVYYLTYTLHYLSLKSTRNAINENAKRLENKMNKVVAMFKADIEIDLKELVKEPHDTIDMSEITAELKKKFENVVNLTDIGEVALQNLDFQGLKVTPTNN